MLETINWAFIERHSFTILLGAIISLNTWKIYLLTRNIKRTQSMSQVPPEMFGLISEQEFKIIKKKSEIITFSIIYSIVSDVSVKCAKLYFRYYSHVWRLAGEYGRTQSSKTAWFFGLDVFLTRVIFIPLNFLLSIAFHTRESNPFIDLLDKLLQLGFTAVVTAMLVLVFIHITGVLGLKSFLYFIIASNVLGIIAVMLYIQEIVPLQFRMMGDDQVGLGIKSLARRVGYPQERIYIESDPDAKPNAFYTGIFGINMIIVTGSLLSALTPEQATSVVAHELGHWEYFHPLMQYLFSIVESAALWIVIMNSFGSALVERIFNLALSEDDRPHPIMSLYLAITFVWSIYKDVYKGIISIYGRRCEFVADDYATNLGYSTDLRQSLLLMAKATENYPLFDRWFSAWFLGHPTILERVQRIDKQLQQNTQI